MMGLSLHGSCGGTSLFACGIRVPFDSDYYDDFLRAIVCMLQTSLFLCVYVSLLLGFTIVHMRASQALS
jgi:hypothetical protein